MIVWVDTDRFILQFADYTVIVSLLTGDENSHGPVVNDFLTWCDSFYK